MKIVTLRDGDEADRLLLVHGFMGSPRDWEDFVKFYPRGSRIDAVILPGHGSRPEAVCDFGSTAEELARVIQKETPAATLIGYSLGGRLALAAACQTEVQRLVLVSSTAGLQDKEERMKRRQADAILAERLKTSQTPEVFQRFLQDWWGQALFISLKEYPDALKKLFARRREHSSEALAEVLKKWSPGRQKPLWNKLRNLKCPSLFLAGEKDAKYTALAKKMATSCPNGNYKIICGAGHMLHVEAPKSLADELTGF
ncbi:MAG: alpha/beta fold hydrolase [Chthoniobacterales bacterium]